MNRLPPLALPIGPDLSEPEPEAEGEAGPPVGAVASPLELLRAIYADPAQPMHRRVRSAIAALPFEHPKLAVVATANVGPSFGAALEDAIRRTAELRAGGVTNLPAVIEAGGDGPEG